MLVLLIAVGVIFYRSYFSETRSNFATAIEARHLAEKCGKSKDKKNCYDIEFKEIASKKGFFTARDILLALQLIEKETQQCHGLAHTISSTAVLRDPPSWKTLIAKSDVGIQTCGGGFLHGILEGYTASHPDFAVDSKFVVETCSQENRVSVQACVHGMGHILLLQTKGDLAQASLICSNTGSSATGCFNGVFMEDAFKTLLVEHGVIESAPDPTEDKIRLNEIISGCLAVKNYDDASEACWANLGHVFAEFYQYNEKKNFSACNKAPSKRAQKNCYFRSVSSLAILPKFEPPEKALLLCKPYEELKDTVTYGNCIGYIAATLVYHSLEFSNQAINFCFAVPDMFQERCSKGFIAMLAQNATRAERIKLCAPLPANLKDDCVLGHADGIKPFQTF